ncbi:MAG: DUF2169 domain-containing protein [Polyangiaceae bacterium]
MSFEKTSEFVPLVAAMRPYRAPAFENPAHKTLAVAVVAKVTFTLVAGAPMRLSDPIALCRADQFRDDDPRASLRAASDLAPRLAAAEVTLVGSAHTTQPTERARARLAVFRGQRPLVDKTLLVTGDRANAAAAPRPFTSMPLVWERAFGGPTLRDNPCGMGAQPDLMGNTVPPNISYPEAPRANLPAGFGPIASGWQARRRLLGAGADALLRAPVLELDARLPVEYFNTAPTDQRLEALHGDERVVLEGIVKDTESFETYLPRAELVARIDHPAGGSMSVPLALDSVRLETDAMRAALVFRGSFTLMDESLAPKLRATVTLSLPQGYSGSVALDPLPPIAASQGSANAAIGTAELGGTIAGSATLAGAQAPSSLRVVPFEAAPNMARSPAAPAGPIAGAPWSPQPAPAVAPASRLATATLGGATGFSVPAPTEPLPAAALEPRRVPPTIPDAPSPPSPTIPDALETRPTEPAPLPGPPRAERAPDAPVFKNAPVEYDVKPAAPAPVPTRPRAPNLRDRLYKR